MNDALPHPDDARPGWEWQEASERERFALEYARMSNPWTMEATADGGDFQPAPAGAHSGVCTRLVDLGTRTPPFADARPRREIQLGFEIDEQMADGRPFTVSMFVAFSLHPKATLRGHLESWRGTALHEGEAFDLSSVVGKPALVTVVHNEHGKARITGLARLPKGMTPLKPADEPIVFSLEAPDWDQFARLHERAQDQIKASPEYARLQQPARVPGSDDGPVTDHGGMGSPAAEFDDDIPFLPMLKGNEYAV